jgi:oxalate---CoA ligase
MHMAASDITEVFETLAADRPDACAIRVPGRRPFLFSHLGAQIRYVRSQLHDWGIDRGDIVAAVLSSRAEMALACATFPAAATFAPLSGKLTVELYLELLARLRPKALLIEHASDHPVRTAAQRLALTELTLLPKPLEAAGLMFTLDLSRPAETLSRKPAADPSWAYILTTSGTTGRAKLVPRSHKVTTTFAEQMGKWLELAPDDVGCHLVPMHHSHGLNPALLLPLLHGSSIVCLPESDIEGYFTALREEGVTWLTAPVTHQREILRRMSQRGSDRVEHRLRFIRVSAGRSDPEELKRIEDAFGVPALVGYGMTEATPITHQPLPPRARKLESAGFAVCGDVAVLDQDRIATDPARRGEIVVRGPLVFDGYYGDDQANASAFLDGWFRTGDLGYFDADRHLHVIGRLDDIVNRGGEKISLLEIDAAIRRVHGVQEAAAFAVAHRTLGQEIVAAVVRSPGATVAASDIRGEVAHRMGAARVPRKFYFVDALPRTDVGKIRRTELSRSLASDSASGTTSALASVSAFREANPLEAALLGVWSSVLEVDSIGLHDDFFLLGGDSLRGAALLERVQAVFRVELPIAALFDAAGTVAGMAHTIAAMRSQPPAP